MKQLSLFFATNQHQAGLVSRLALAFVLLPHGSQLLFGWLGGYGFKGTMAYFTGVERLPWIIGFMVIMLQSLGAMLLLFGFMGRFLALGLTMLFIGMIVTSHWQHGFFMNWMGNQQGEGFEYHILAIGLSLAILVNGSGSYSLDALLTKKFKTKYLASDLTAANI